MSREVIQDFLNSAGIVGIALTNRRMRPYFYGLDAVLDKTKQALGQGVLQVVENLPEGFESFEFHFVGHVVFIYKLTHGLVLLVLTDSGLKPVDYQRGITKIKHLIETDTYNTVAHFKLLLGSVTQHSLPSTDWNASAAKTPVKTNVPNRLATQSLANTINPYQEPLSSPDPSLTTAQQVQNNRTERANVNPKVQVQSTTTKSQTTKSQTPSAPSPKTSAIANSTKNTDISTMSVSAKTDPQEFKLDELLASLNKLSQFTTQYLGKVVVTNYWKSSRPDSTWLVEFEIDRSGQISHSQQTAIACTSAQHQLIKSWVTSYIKRCKQVIRNFDQMIEQDCLDERQRQILL